MLRVCLLSIAQDCMWKRPFAWGLMELGVILGNWQGRHSAVERDEGLGGMECKYHRSRSLSCIYSVLYTQTHFLFFLSKLLKHFMASCVKKHLIPYFPVVARTRGLCQSPGWLLLSHGENYTYLLVASVIMSHHEQQGFRRDALNKLSHWLRVICRVKARQ